jgi:hypothetical protein
MRVSVALRCISAVILIGAGLSSGDLLAYEEEVRIVDGEVTAVDEINRDLTVKYMVDDINIVYEELSFHNIAKNPRIFKGDERIELDDMQVGDNVSVKYIPSRYNEATDKVKNSVMVSMTVEQ